MIVGKTLLHLQNQHAADYINFNDMTKQQNEAITAIVTLHANIDESVINK